MPKNANDRDVCLPDIYNSSIPHRCPRMHPNPLVCPCPTCEMARRSAASKAALKRAIAKAYGAPTGPIMPATQVIKEEVVPKETTREKIARQRRERYIQSEKDWQYIQANQAPYAAHREKVLAERKAAQQKVSFELGWMQSPITQSQDDLWDSLFTSDTKQAQQQFIRHCNLHLNDPVCEGEIVLLPTTEPETDQQRELLNLWVEQAKIASTELGKLLDEEVATLNRHFELFSHQLDERIKSDGLPSDYYAQVSTGVGATAAIVEQNLKNIQNVLLEINDLYVSQVAMASRTGGVNYGAFVGERAELFKKLDGSFAMLSKRSVQLPVYTQIKRNLKLSTKSVIHNGDEILKAGLVKELGKRIGNIALGISASRGLGYVGLVVGAASGMSNIYEACKVDGTGDCGKVTTREVWGFIGGVVVGAQGGSIGAGIAAAAISGIALIIGVTASTPVLAVASISGAVAGSFAGGIAGGTAGKTMGDFLYEATIELYEWGAELL